MQYLLDARLLRCNNFTVWGVGGWLLPRRWSGSGPAAAQQSLYDVLGVSPSATGKQIKLAYFRLSKQHHPDRPGGNAEHFRQLTEAYGVLGRRDSRQRYDADLQRGGRAAPARSHGDAGTAHTWRRPHPTGAPIRNFNHAEWMRMHYSDMRERKKRSKEDIDQYFADKKSYESSVKSMNLYFVLTLAVVILIWKL